HHLTRRPRLIVRVSFFVRRTRTSPNCLTRFVTSSVFDTTAIKRKRPTSTGSSGSFSSTINDILVRWARKKSNAFSHLLLWTGRSARLHRIRRYTPYSSCIVTCWHKRWAGSTTWSQQNAPNDYPPYSRSRK